MTTMTSISEKPLSQFPFDSPDRALTLLERTPFKDLKKMCDTCKLFRNQREALLNSIADVVDRNLKLLEPLRSISEETYDAYDYLSRFKTREAQDSTSSRPSIAFMKAHFNSLFSGNLPYNRPDTTVVEFDSDMKALIQRANEKNTLDLQKADSLLNAFITQRTYHQYTLSHTEAG